MDIGLSEDYREDMNEGLSEVLADTYTLMLKSQNFHWNVKGDFFHDLHEVFEDQYNALWGAVDDIAERIKMLGGLAPGSFSDLSRLSSLEESTGDIDVESMVEELLEDHEKLARGCRELIQLAAENGDDGTTDMLTERLRFHEQTAWMLRSRLA